MFNVQVIDVNLCPLVLVIFIVLMIDFNFIEDEETKEMFPVPGVIIPTISQN